jgi:hypothetical protein
LPGSNVVTVPSDEVVVVVVVDSVATGFFIVDSVVVVSVAAGFFVADSVVVVLVCANAKGAIAAQARMSMLFFIIVTSNVNVVIQV